MDETTIRLVVTALLGIAISHEDARIKRFGTFALGIMDEAIEIILGVSEFLDEENEENEGLSEETTESEVS